MITIRRGLNLPISGDPEQHISDGPKIRSVALVGNDYKGMKPTMSVQVGDRVKKGQVLFSDKKTPGVLYTSPGAGVVSAINRGERRVLQSVVIDLEGDEYEQFDQYNADQCRELSEQLVRDNLVRSGLWTAFRTRPFSRVPAIDSTPNSIFVNAMDTNPLAAAPEIIIATAKEDFRLGLQILCKLTEGQVFLCKEAGADIDNGNIAQVHVEEFSGVHPAGNSGTHIHFLDPVSADKTVWTISYQDVIAFARLFTSGQLPVERIVSLAGPSVKSPRLIKTRLGASLIDMTANELLDQKNRIISGSVFGGRRCHAAFLYLGRFHQQVSVLREEDERPFIHYMRAGFNRFSVLPIYISSLFRNKKFAMSTTTNGSERAMVPVGAYERVMPLDILPTQLLRALIVGDTDTAQKLGCLELDEEDLALCTFVCPGKYEYGPILRDNLARIEIEG